MNQKELKILGRGIGFDGAAIACMLMQAFNPGTYWDYLGNAGYFVQAAAIWFGLLILPLVLVAHGMIRDLPQVRTDKEQKFVELMVQVQSRSKLYRQCTFAKEFGICLLFAGMGWGWLAMGNLLALFLMSMVWSSAKVDGAQRA
jgi:hypothetical protein